MDHSARPLGPRYAKGTQVLSNGRRIRVVSSSPAPREESFEASRDPVLGRVDSLLRTFARWAQQNRSALGYPTISTLFRAMLTTKVGIVRGGTLPDPKVVDAIADIVQVIYANAASGSETRSFKPREVMDAPEIMMQVDHAWAQLTGKLRRVMAAHYFVHGTIEERCRKTSYKRARYLQLVECAQYAIYAALITTTCVDLL
jgi:hypothetical protein